MCLPSDFRDKADLQAGIRISTAECID
ncbi:hypothetical protein YPPY96_0199, partial [Yersinia pestis PY-96]